MVLKEKDNPYDMKVIEYRKIKENSISDYYTLR
jgi:hypothetical protein